MPSLTWDNKQLAAVQPARYTVDSRVLPGGCNLPADKNVLVLGNNLTALHSLFSGAVDRPSLIYADPPFFSNKVFAARAGRGEDSRNPHSWDMVEGYSDRWASLDDYLDFLYQRIVAMHAVLADHGTLYLHLDWRASAYAKLMLDEVFGRENFLNEVVWTYHGPSPIRSAFNRKHDTILVYTKNRDYVFNADDVRIPYDPSTLRTFNSSKAGFGKRPNLERGKVPEDHWSFPVVARLHKERTGYPTQKPEALLERVIRASSRPGDLVADFFCGSGTTAAVANRLGRRFFTIDRSPLAVLTARARLLRNAQCQPFSVLVEDQMSFPAGEALRVLCNQTNEVTLQASADHFIGWEIGQLGTDNTFVSLAQADCDQPLRIPDGMGPWHIRAATSTGLLRSAVLP